MRLRGAFKVGPKAQRGDFCSRACKGRAEGGRTDEMAQLTQRALRNFLAKVAEMRELSAKVKELESAAKAGG